MDDLIAQDSWGVDVGSYEVAKLLKLWKLCGFTRSLQSIYSGTEVIEVKRCCFCKDVFFMGDSGCSCTRNGERSGKPQISSKLKDPSAEALFNYLIELNLK